ncbi:MAG: hypothetical protein WCY47_05635 [Pusillimonas sp.]
MNKNIAVAVVICVVLSAAVWIGSTGWGYAVYRPIRNYDLFSLAIAWIGVIFALVKDHRK